MSNMAERTTTVPHQTSDVPMGARVGFWRRVLAFLIDSLIVSVVVQLTVAGLFFATSGRVQIYGDLTYTTCSAPTGVPNGLPAPPAGADYARECTITFLGAPTAKVLQVGQKNDGAIARSGTVVTTAVADVLKIYLLDKSGRPVDGMLLDWAAMLVLIAYILAMQTFTGATLGSRAMGIRVIDIAAPSRSGVPPRKIARRHLAMLSGFLPLIAVAVVYFGFVAAPGELSAFLVKIFQQQAFIQELKTVSVQWHPLLANYLLDLPDMMLRDGAFASGKIELWFDLAALTLSGWIIFLIVQIVRRRDPVYDRIAGTRVVRR